MSKEKSSGINWSRVFDMDGARTEEGVPDMKAMIDMLAVEAYSWVAKNDIPVENIAEAFEKVIEKHPEEKFDLAGIVHHAMNEIANLQPGSESRTQKRMAEWLRGQSKIFTEGGEGKWHVSRGHAARVQRCTPEYSEAYWKRKNLEEEKIAKVMRPQ